jgi:hypothetical protein
MPHVKAEGRGTQKPADLATPRSPADDYCYMHHLVTGAHSIQQSDCAFCSSAEPVPDSASKTRVHYELVPLDRFFLKPAEHFGNLFQVLGLDPVAGAHERVVEGACEVVRPILPSKLHAIACQNDLNHEAHSVTSGRSPNFAARIIFTAARPNRCPFSSPGIGVSRVASPAALSKRKVPLVSAPSPKLKVAEFPSSNSFMILM